jgi:hypothetical protein
MVDAGSSGAEVGNWIVWAGMAIGGAVAGFVARSGWKSPDGGSPEKEYAISGQASITDMGPIRDLAPRLSAIVDALEGTAKEQSRTAQSIERLVSIVEKYIEAQQTERDNEDEVERRVAGRLSTANADEVRKQVKAISARNTRARAAARSKKDHPTG